MDRHERGLGEDVPRRKRLNKRVRVSTDGYRPQKVARTEILGDKRRLEDIPVLHRQSGEDKEI